MKLYLIQHGEAKSELEEPERSLTSKGEEEVIEKILKHLGLWDLKVRPPPKEKASFVTISIDDSYSQVPFFAPPFYLDPDYPMDSYRISKRHGVSLMVMISAIYHMLPILQRSHDLIFIYSLGIRDFYQ